MSNSKILILLPDGLGLRNFAYSKFPEIANANQSELIYWNATAFVLSDLGLQNIKLEGQPHYKTDLMKRARKRIELHNFSKQFENDIFKAYLFKSQQRVLKQFIKNRWVDVLFHSYKNRLQKLRERIKQNERQTAYYKKCREVLKMQKPDILFCTNQRPVNAIAPILAAQDLGIPTASFIFSWDNLPKATMVLEPDHYLVWSRHMANELGKYYSYIDKNQVHITGSPQFEMHFDPKIIQSREEFCKIHKLDSNKRYLCFSGDDITTSPHDQDYLRDVLEAVEHLNHKGHNFAVIFRPCPVDFSTRYDEILEAFSNIVYRIRPAWSKKGNIWNAVLPLKADQFLLSNSMKHADLVINLGSSMVFDAACYQTPCAYISYNPDVETLQKDIRSIYRYIHFQSMPNSESVIWFHSKAEIADKILEGLNNPNPYVENAHKWFEIVNQHPLQEASKRIISTLNEIINS